MRTRQRSSHVVAAVAAFALASCSVTSPSTSPSPTSPGPSPTPAATNPPATATAATPTARPTANSGPVDLASIQIALEPFASVPGGPLAMSAPNDGSGRIFVAAQDGKIWVIERDGSVLDTPMVNLDARIQSGGEQGLLGLAVHPRFPSDPRVFINYTDNSGDTVVASLTLDPGNPDRLDPDSIRQILALDDPFANHNGGATLFGPDGYLYVSLGDGGGGGDPQENGQNRNALLAKILRLDIDVASGDLDYVIPPDNPFVDRNGADEVWLWGLRNPWRMSFDRVTGDLWIGDVGQGAYEEIDVARAGVGGLNFGWNRMEGAHCYGGDGCDQDGLTLPVTEYGRDFGCTVIGGYVYRGSAYPVLQGAYLFADYCSGRMFAIDAATTELVEPVEVGTGDARISAFGEDADGELYVTVLDGGIWRVVATEP